MRTIVDWMQENGWTDEYRLEIDNPKNLINFDKLHASWILRNTPLDDQLLESFVFEESIMGGQFWLTRFVELILSEGIV